VTVEVDGVPGREGGVEGVEDGGHVGGGGGREVGDGEVVILGIGYLGLVIG
jgi:hypothetical protein